MGVGKARKTLKSLVLIFYYLSNAKGLSQNGTAQNITLYNISTKCHCAKLFINHDVKIVINSTAANNVNKIPVLLTKTQCLQGFFYVLRVKKDLAELLLQGLNLIFNFALWLINGFTH